MIKDYMKAAPFTTTQDVPLKEAVEQMDQFKIRHLPVESAGELVGVLLSTDAVHALSLQPNRILKVEDVMLRQPFAASPYTDLASVVLTMSESKHDYVIVHEGGRVLGIFTATDALRVLADFIINRISLAA
jgi:CBS domain-containing protein